jgi:hypothetical protein
MWAVIKNNIVIDCYVDIPYDEMIKQAEQAGYTDLVQMTLENSPAYIGGYWDGNKFYRERK